MTGQHAIRETSTKPAEEETFWDFIGRVNEWISERPPAFGDRLQWAVGKTVEEIGEVQEAMSAAANQNRRKAGGSLTDVSKELCDVILAASTALDLLHQGYDVPGSAESALNNRIVVISGRIEG